LVFRRQAHWGARQAEVDAGLDASEGVRPLARGLMMAVLGGAGHSPAVADRILAEAEALRVDPLEYCAHRLGLGDITVYQRAAHWAKFAFWSVVPDSPQDMDVDRVDGLAGVRTVARPIFDRQVTFCAPRFDDLLRLASAQLVNRELARRLCIVPPRAIRAALQQACSRQLLVEASQRLTRRWPQASANIDLSRPARAIFVMLFVVVVLVVAVAPLLLSAVLLPAVALLVLLPAALRFAVALLPRSGTDPVPLLEDTELPVYTILIPLRDEAGMVPLLRDAMRALEACEYS
jgi:glycosyltransferase XagB